MMLRRDMMSSALPGRPRFGVRAKVSWATFSASPVISSDAERLG